MCHFWAKSNSKTLKTLTQLNGARFPLLPDHTKYAKDCECGTYRDDKPRDPHGRFIHLLATTLFPPLHLPLPPEQIARKHTIPMITRNANGERTQANSK